MSGARALRRPGAPRQGGAAKRERQHSIFGDDDDLGAAKVSRRSAPAAAAAGEPPPLQRTGSGSSAAGTAQAGSSDEGGTPDNSSEPPLSQSSLLRSSSLFGPGEPKAPPVQRQRQRQQRAGGARSATSSPLGQRRALDASASFGLESQEHSQDLELQQLTRRGSAVQTDMEGELMYTLDGLEEHVPTPTRLISAVELLRLVTGSKLRSFRPEIPGILSKLARVSQPEPRAGRDAAALWRAVCLCAAALLADRQNEPHLDRSSWESALILLRNAGAKSNPSDLSSSAASSQWLASPQGLPPRAAPLPPRQEDPFAVEFSFDSDPPLRERPRGNESRQAATLEEAHRALPRLGERVLEGLSTGGERCAAGEPLDAVLLCAVKQLVKNATRGLEEAETRTPKRRARTFQSRRKEQPEHADAAETVQQQAPPVARYVAINAGEVFPPVFDAASDSSAAGLRAAARALDLLELLGIFQDSRNLVGADTFSAACRLLRAASRRAADSRDEAEAAQCVAKCTCVLYHLTHERDSLRQAEADALSAVCPELSIHVVQSVKGLVASRPEERSNPIGVGQGTDLLLWAMCRVPAVRQSILLNEDLAPTMIEAWQARKDTNADYIVAGYCAQLAAVLALESPAARSVVEKAVLQSGGDQCVPFKQLSGWLKGFVTWKSENNMLTKQALKELFAITSRLDAA
eukprot:TRINITY_DN65939_c0_g1_i1.p1 TRINITY_DN65939_c0_g1~~TRINITY_DN65939_c0_g1_i1.p1  ORF type:complete len:718 (+),score=188.89 TRINITY_DN65939_c0_g1_i1:82-2154(+)